MLSQKTMMEAYRQGVLTKMAELGVKPEVASGILKQSVDWGRLGKSVALSSGIVGTTALPYALGAAKTNSNNPITNTVAGYNQIGQGLSSGITSAVKGWNKLKGGVSSGWNSLENANTRLWQGVGRAIDEGNGRGGAGSTGGSVMQQKRDHVLNGGAPQGRNPTDPRNAYNPDRVGGPKGSTPAGSDLGMNNLAPAESVSANGVQPGSGQVPSYMSDRFDGWDVK